MAVAISDFPREAKAKTHRYSSTVSNEYKANAFRALVSNGMSMIRVKVMGTVLRTLKEGFVIKPEDSKYDNVFCEKGMIDCDFDLATGDLVDLEGLVPSNETKNVGIELQNVSPHRISVSEGRILKWNGTVGTISSFADFTVSVCQKGYAPRRNDQIVGVFVQCKKGNYENRALKVIPLLKGMVATQEIDALKKMYVKDRRDVHVDDTCTVFVDLGTSKPLTLNVRNNGYVPCKMRRVCRMSMEDDPPVELEDPRSFEEREIQPSEVVTFRFKITGKELGKSHTHFCWTFDNYQVSRFIEVDVVDMSLLKDLSIHTSSMHMKKRKNINAAQLIALATSRLVHSTRSYKPSSKCTIHLPSFPLPQIIIKAALPEEPMSQLDILDRVFRTLPCIAQDLAPTNYAMQMHGLLFLEEVARIKEIGELELENVTFRVENDSMILDVPPLSSYISRLVVGDTIIVSNADSEKDTLRYEGCITKILPTELWIQFGKKFHKKFTDEDIFNVYFVNNRTTLRRMHQAINLVISNLGVNWLFPKVVESRLPQVFQSELEPKSTKRYSDFRTNNFPQKKLTINNINNFGRATYGDSVIDSSAKLCHPAIAAIEKKVNWFNKELNEQQKEAVINILLGEARPLPYIIFGPPGTGKTDTVVEVVLQIHSMISDSRILVTSPSNSSADLVAERLLGVGYLHHKDLLRLVGHHYCEQERLPSYLAPYSCEPSNSPVVDKKNKTNGEPVVKERIPRVTVSTLGCHGVMYNLGLKRGHYTHIIIDEAGQATEPETLIPMSFMDPREGQIVLAGDPLQLGPVVTSRVASRQGLQESFLSRVLKTPPYHNNHEGYDRRLVTKLTMNYRSLPQILHLSSTLFYDNDLIPHVAEDQDCPEVNLLKVLGDGLPCHKSGKSPPLLFHGIQGKSSQVPGGHSWFNHDETVQSILYLRAFYEAGLTPGQVGIITPYQLQARYIKSALMKLNIPSPKVGSIEEFQGQERMAMIFSVVRSARGEVSDSMYQMITFVAHAQRLNVALSRARAVLIIVGDPHLLALDPNWRSIIKHCVTNNVYLGCPLPSTLN